MVGTHTTDILNEGVVMERKLLDLTEKEFDDKAIKLIHDVSVNHFLEAADKLFDEKANRLVNQFTGKDIRKNEDILCIRKTHDFSQNKRIISDKAMLSDGYKKNVNILSTVLAIILGAIGIIINQ